MLTTESSGAAAPTDNSVTCIIVGMCMCSTIVCISTLSATYLSTHDRFYMYMTVDKVCAITFTTMPPSAAPGGGDLLEAPRDEVEGTPRDCIQRDRYIPPSSNNTYIHIHIHVHILSG